MNKLCSHLLLIEPARFDFNEMTAVNNVFQQRPAGSIHETALEEFHQFTRLLEENRIDLTIIRDKTEPHSPDAVFPNNWISFHDDGNLVLYPMFAPNRRQERKLSILEEIKKKFAIKSIHDLSKYEKSGRFLEGTGSLVLDRQNRLAYACLSPRTHAEPLEEFCRICDYKPVVFHAETADGTAIYHTNVLMCLGDCFVVICLDSIKNEEELKLLIGQFQESKKVIIEINMKQLHHFAGNMLQVKNRDGEPLLIMSTQAFNSLSLEQVNELDSFNRIIHSPLDTIESAGGGSARCMLAEVWQ